VPNIFARRRAYLAWSVLALTIAVAGTVLKVAMVAPSWILVALLAALVVCAEGIRRTAPEDKGQHGRR
jgi:hypothetical protein